MLESFLPIFATLFIVIDPLGIVPIFISLSGGMDAAERKAATRKAVGIAFCVLAFFALGGKFILDFLQVRPGAFFVAGGVMLFISALGMLMGEAQRSRRSKDEIADDARDIAVFPLAIPLISGPGAITTILLYMSRAEDYLGTAFMVIGASALALCAVFATMSASARILKVLGKTGVSVIERIMGLLLAGLAVQFCYDGLAKLGVIAPHIGQ
jgi:multiple antibiotic resistance protein